MMSNRRRMTLIAFSVIGGSLISYLILRSRLGTLKPSDYFQLGFNFLFAIAIVVGISILLQRMNKQDDEMNKKNSGK